MAAVASNESLASNFQRTSNLAGSSEEATPVCKEFPRNRGQSEGLTAGAGADKRGNPKRPAPKTNPVRKQDRRRDIGGFPKKAFRRFIKPLDTRSEDRIRKPLAD